MSGESIAEWVPLVRDVVLMVVVPLAAWAVRKWVLADAGDKRRREVADGARIVYHLVEAVSRKTPNSLDDKLAEALGRLSDSLGGALSDEERRAAESVFAAEASKEKGASLNLAKLGMGIGTLPK